MVSSPVGILVRAATRCFPSLRCFGICEVPLVHRREICNAVRADIERVDFEYLGVNHLGWLYAVTIGERDLVTEWAALPRTGFPNAELIAEWNAIPTKYLRLHFEAVEVLRSQRSALETRSAALLRMQASAHDVYATGSEGDVRRAIARRQTPWYSDAVAPLIMALHAGTSGAFRDPCAGPLLGPFFLSARNEESVPGFLNDDILEFPYTVRDGRLCRSPMSRAPPAMVADLVSAFCRYERLGTEAVIGRTLSLVEAALAVHPWVAPAAARDPHLVRSVAAAIWDGALGTSALS
jgi:6-phospho-beta-glucosidase